MSRAPGTNGPNQGQDGLARSKEPACSPDVSAAELRRDQEQRTPSDGPAEEIASSKKALDEALALDPSLGKICFFCGSNPALQSVAIIVPLSESVRLRPDSVALVQRPSIFVPRCRQCRMLHEILELQIMTAMTAAALGVLAVIVWRGLGLTITVITLGVLVPIQLCWMLRTRNLRRRIKPKHQYAEYPPIQELLFKRWRLSEGLPPWKVASLASQWSAWGHAARGLKCPLCGQRTTFDLPTPLLLAALAGTQTPGSVERSTASREMLAVAEAVAAPKVQRCGRCGEQFESKWAPWKSPPASDYFLWRPVQPKGQALRT